MNNIKKVKLKDICIFQEGYVNPAQTHPEYFEGNIKWLRASDINSTFIYDTSKKLQKPAIKAQEKVLYFLNQILLLLVRVEQSES